MNTKRLLFVLAVICMVGLNYSCEKETVDESDEIISIKKTDIKEEDT